MKTFASPTLVVSGLLLSLSLQGCLSVPINIRSNPQGATIVASGEAIGTTPMEVYADDIFPAQRVGIGWERQGTLRFEKAGCAPLTMDVNNELLKRSIKVDLECDPAAAAAAEQRSASPTSAPATAAPAATTTVPAAVAPAASAGAVRKLEEIEQLHERGLITDDEYHALRQRVLDRF